MVDVECENADTYSCLVPEMVVGGVVHGILLELPFGAILVARRLIPELGNHVEQEVVERIELLLLVGVPEWLVDGFQHQFERSDLRLDQHLTGGRQSDQQQKSC